MTEKREVPPRVQRVQQIRRSSASGPIQSLKKKEKPLNINNICYGCGQALHKCEC